jgi:hypothetical protein
MNNAVDTFDRPSVSRAQSQVDTNSELGSEKVANASPTRFNVKAYASALDRDDAASRSSSPIREGRCSPFRSILGGSSSSAGRHGSVKKEIEERETLCSDTILPRLSAHMRPTQTLSSTGEPLTLPISESRILPLLAVYLLLKSLARPFGARRDTTLSRLLLHRICHWDQKTRWHFALMEEN